MAVTSSAYTRAPMTRGALARGNRGEICNRFRLKIVVADSATCAVPAAKNTDMPLLDSKIGGGLFASIALNLILDGLSLIE
jgi:hypothetical protein